MMYKTHLAGKRSSRISGMACWKQRVSRSSMVFEQTIFPL